MVNIISRAVVPGCAGCAMAHPDFGRSVNPISTWGYKLCPPNYYWHTRIFRPYDSPDKCLWLHFYYFYALCDVISIGKSNFVCFLLCGLTNPLWYFRLCFLKLPCSAYSLPHISHGNFLSMWINWMCFTSLSLRLKAVPQTSHLWGNSPRCLTGIKKSDQLIKVH